MYKPNILLKLNHIFKSYVVGKTIIEPLKDVSLCIEENCCYGIIGSSGSGKSTLCKIIVGLEPYDSGEIEFQYKKINHNQYSIIRSSTSFIFQNARNSLDPTMRIRDIISEPLHYQKYSDNLGIEYVCQKVGIENLLLDKYSHQLSGGQCQKIAIARAIITKPKLLICDEPTSSLDVSTQTRVATLLKKLVNEFGISLLFVSHNEYIVRFLCEKIYKIENGLLKNLNPVNDTPIF